MCYFASGPVRACSIPAPESLLQTHLLPRHHELPVAGSWTVPGYFGVFVACACTTSKSTKLFLHQHRIGEPALRNRRRHGARRLDRREAECFELIGVGLEQSPMSSAMLAMSAVGRLIAQSRLPHTVAKE